MGDATEGWDLAGDGTWTAAHGHPGAAAGAPAGGAAAPGHRQGAADCGGADPRGRRGAVAAGRRAGSRSAWCTGRATTTGACPRASSTAASTRWPRPCARSQEETGVPAVPQLRLPDVELHAAGRRAQDVSILADARPATAPARCRTPTRSTSSPGCRWRAAAARLTYPDERPAARGTSPRCRRSPRCCALVRHAHAGERKRGPGDDAAAADRRRRCEAEADRLGRAAGAVRPAPAGGGHPAALRADARAAGRRRSRPADRRRRGVRRAGAGAEELPDRVEPRPRPGWPSCGRPDRVVVCSQGKVMPHAAGVCCTARRSHEPFKTPQGRRLAAHLVRRRGLDWAPSAGC